MELEAGLRAPEVVQFVEPVPEVDADRAKRGN